MKTIAYIAAGIMVLLIILTSGPQVSNLITTDSWDIRIIQAIVMLIPIIVAPIIVGVAVYYGLLALGNVWHRIT